MPQNKEKPTNNDVYIELVCTKGDLFVLAANVHVLSYAMMDSPDDHRAILYSIIMNYLKPYLPEGG